MYPTISSRTRSGQSRRARSMRSGWRKWTEPLYASKMTPLCRKKQP
jgi:hypothetical protein